jgi:hypothetical protein
MSVYSSFILMNTTLLISFVPTDDSVGKTTCGDPASRCQQLGTIRLYLDGGIGKFGVLASVIIFLYVMCAFAHHVIHVQYAELSVRDMNDLVRRWLKHVGIGVYPSYTPRERRVLF